LNTEPLWIGSRGMTISLSLACPKPAGTPLTVTRETSRPARSSENSFSHFWAMMESSALPSSVPGPGATSTSRS
jgi:hypothetical protein